MDLKKDIRKRVLDRRENMSKEEWAENSRNIYEKVVTHSFFLDTDILYCYMDYKNEVSTRMIIQKAWELNKTVYVPKVNGEEMTFHPIRSFLELEECYRGIPEPTSNPVNIINPGLVIIPGVAFDRNLNRVGYGKGYYDRFLSHNDNLRTLAICFELQLEEKIPSDSFDIRPEVLITERHVYVKKIT